MVRSRVWETSAPEGTTKLGPEEETEQKIVWAEPKSTSPSQMNGGAPARQRDLAADKHWLFIIPTRTPFRFQTLHPGRQGRFTPTSVLI